MDIEQLEPPTPEEAVGLLTVFEMAGIEMPVEFRTVLMALPPAEREALRERLPLWLDLQRSLDSGCEPTEEDLEKIRRLADKLGRKDLLE